MGGAPRVRKAVVPPLGPSEKKPAGRPERARKAVAEGPYRVPVATVDWLLSREAPAARYAALRDLLSRSPKDIELRKARLALPRDVWVRDSLPALRRRLAHELSNAQLLKKWDGGLWQALFLAEAGLDLSFPEMRHAGDVVFARLEGAFVAIERGEAPSLPRRLVSFGCRFLATIGHASDTRVATGADWIARRRLAEDVAPPSPDATLAKDLLLFTLVPDAARTDAVRAAVGFSVERALGSELPDGPASDAHREAEKAAYPVGDRADRLELLVALAAADAPLSPRLATALDRLAARADHRGRWTLERGLDPAPPYVEERPGELSRRVTVRALSVMQRWKGLTIA